MHTLLGCVASRPLRAPYLPHPSAIFASRSLSSPSFRHWILEPLDLGFLVLLIFSSSDLLLPCVDVTDRPGYDRIFPSPPFGPRHLPVHCRLVSCTCTLLVIYTDPAAPFSHISQSSLEASTICLPWRCRIFFLPKAPFEFPPNEWGSPRIGENVELGGGVL